jgi:hypothetical protein
MKKLLALSILVTVAIALALGSLTGCGSLSNGPSGQTSVDTNLIDKTAVVLRTTTTDLAIIAIEKDKNAASYFRLAASVIDKLLDGGDLSPVTLRKAISGIPVKELQSATARVAITTVLGSYEIYWGDYVRGKIGANYAAATLLKAVKDGISGALPADSRLHYGATTLTS